jgi:tetratricopeptide (TPR) repeat protein
MNKRFHLGRKRQPNFRPSNESSSVRVNSRRIKPWQAIIMPIVSLLVFFLLLEGALALFGVKPVFITEDPFVGFASNAPLFSPIPGPRENQMLTTAQNKIYYFNKQVFPLKKLPGTYRIFSMGGSTTFGRPYDDKTSFSGWLRQLLPAADNHKRWEVINAGGISYASYRVAHLMEELIHYQPDLFIIYTGHNEFLEERTYGEIRDMSPVIKTALSLLHKTRTYSAMNSAVQALGLKPRQTNSKRQTLGIRVDAILDLSIGLDHYTRDDTLRENILKHFRISLERMVALARSVDAQVIFVTPASSQNDCAPFKSEHTPGLSPMIQKRVEQMLKEAKEAMQAENWQVALSLLEKASGEDPRHAELQYRLGQTLMALGRFDEAKKSFQIASDEDICPLRALTPMCRIVTEVARDQGAGLVDYVGILERLTQETKGYSILGANLFLDHVHPTIEGNKILALALIDKLIEQGIVHPGPEWNEQTIAKVSTSIERQIDRETHGQALANLARVLLWAGKQEDAERTALQARETAGDIGQIAVDTANILSTVYANRGDLDRSMQTLYSTLKAEPLALEIRLKLAENYLNPKFLQPEKAAAQFLLFSHFSPSYDRAHALYGHVMARRGRMDLAYPSLMEALRLNPNNTAAKEYLAEVLNALGAQLPNPTPAPTRLDTYSSKAPRMLEQVRPGPDGHPFIDGIKVEFYENGRLKYFADVKQGKLDGAEMTWDPDGRLLSQKTYKNGVPVVEESGS